MKAFLVKQGTITIDFKKSDISAVTTQHISFEQMNAIKLIHWNPKKLSSLNFTQNFQHSSIQEVILSNLDNSSPLTKEDITNTANYIIKLLPKKVSIIYSNLNSQNITQLLRLFKESSLKLQKLNFEGNNIIVTKDFSKMISEFKIQELLLHNNPIPLANLLNFSFQNQLEHLSFSINNTVSEDSIFFLLLSLRDKTLNTLEIYTDKFDKPLVDSMASVLRGMHVQTLRVIQDDFKVGLCIALLKALQPSGVQNLIVSSKNFHNVDQWVEEFRKPRDSHALMSICKPSLEISPIPEALKPLMFQFNQLQRKAFVPYLTKCMSDVSITPPPKKMAPKNFKPSLS